jgi:hypothetical protein
VKVRVIHPITTNKGTTPAGAIIEIPESFLEKLKGKVEAFGDPKSFSHYCRPADCHCSAKIPDADYPTGCIRIGCDHYHASQ